jgi:hypothetical protein
MKTTAYKDVNGNLHEDKIQCEVVNLFHDLDMDEKENRVDTIKLLESTIESGKKAQRLLRLLTGK